MNPIHRLRFAAAVFCLGAVVTAGAAPVTYRIDPNHTYPAFEADHWHGLSIWRGKVTRTSGTIVLDKEAETGTVDVTMQMDSVDFGNAALNASAGSEIFDVAEFPTATYVGQLADFEDGKPTSVKGTLTLHGVSKPVDLTIKHFQCQPHFQTKREVCGADAAATINRGDFGVDIDLANGFFPEVRLLISIEAQVGGSGPGPGGRPGPRPGDPGMRPPGGTP